VGVHPATRDAAGRKRRSAEATTPLEEALSNSGTLTYHPMQMRRHDVPKRFDDETVYYSTTQRPAGRMMIPDAPLANRAASARRLEAHRDTPAVVPQPLAITAVVVNDSLTALCFAVCLTI
jgi:hypothetical protein